MRTAVFESFDPARQGWSVCLTEPRAVRVASRYNQVLPALQAAEEAARNGCWAAVLLAYEAAPVFDSALKVHAPGQFPLALVAIFDQASSQPTERRPGTYRASAWEPQIPRAEYESAIRRIRDYIARGNTYQTNYTFPLHCQFAGDSWSWYRELGAAQGAGYCAYLDLGSYKVLSISPELFFERRGQKLIARPMKGTMPRGRWAAEDEELAGRLAACEKNRAENVMIVDLLRNDLGKVAVAGTVRVSSLFEIERYETLWQMTSTIEAAQRPATSLTDLFRALFPCGSITGAPKVSTMEIIHELEPFPRQIYTGAIGFVRPGGDCVFSVAIRTILLDTETGKATFGVGGGITYDSTPEGEYDECVLKTSFLQQRWPAFRLLETIRLDEGNYFLLGRHLERMRSSANHFGFRWNEAAVRSALDQAKAQYGRGVWRVRWLAARDGAISLEAHALEAPDKHVQHVAFAPQPIDDRDTRSSFTKPLSARFTNKRCASGRIATILSSGTKKEK